MSILNSPKRLYEFRNFRLDSGERVLLRNGEVVPLAPKVFDTLLLLVQNSGRTLDKEALMKELWPDTFVEEANLAQHISLLRKALGENATEPQFIETIPRRGYRFLAKVGEIRGRREPRAPSARRLILGIALFASGFLASSLLFLAWPDKTSSYRFTPLVVDSSLKISPAWSPSGKTVAYAGEAQGILQVFTRTLGSPAATQITRHPTDCLAPFWSPDGQRIFFQAVAGTGPEIGNKAFDLWSVGAAGGTPELVMKGIWYAALSPDGRTLAFVRSDRPGGLGEVWLLSFPGGEPKRYTQAPFGIRLFNSYAHLQFSPDGSMLGASVFATVSKPEFWILPLPTGEPRRALTSFVAYGNSKFSWMTDNRRVVIAENLLATSNSHLLVADTERISLEPLTAGVAAEQSPAVSPDGDSIAFASMEGSYDVVEVALGRPEIRTLISTARSEATPGWSPLGNFYAYSTNRNGSAEIWLKHRTEGWDRPLVTRKDFGLDKTSAIFDVAFSPDGQRIAYRRGGAKGEAVWISTLAGDPPVRLVQEPGGYQQRGPTWSPDGAWIAYYSTRDGKATVMKARVGGSGAPIPLPHDVHLYYPRWSPTGEWLACRAVPGIVLISPDSAIRRTVSERWWMIHGWSKDGKRIYAIRATEQRRLILASIDIQAGTETTLGDLGPYPAAFTYGDSLAAVSFRGYSLAPDGKSFATSIFRARGDIWLMEGLRPPAGFWRTLFRGRGSN